MAYALEVFVLVSRSSIDEYTDSRERARQSLCRNPDAIGKRCYLVKFCGILYLVRKPEQIHWRGLMYLLYWVNDRC